MNRKWLSILITVALAVSLLGALPVPKALAATKTWDGGAGTNKWSDASNWSPDGVPTAGDTVVLDNSNVAGSYTVVIDGSVTTAQTIDKLVVGYAGNPNAITLNIASSNTVGSVITLQSAAPDNIQLVIDQGGVINNQSGASSGRAILFSGTTKIWQMNNNASYIHNTTTGTLRPSSGQNVWSFSGTSVFEYRSPSTGSFSIVASGVTYQNLRLIAGAATATYANSGSNPLVIKGDFTIGTSVTFNPALTASTTFRGNISNNGTWNTNSSGAILFDGDTTISGASTTLFNAGLTVNAGKTFTLAQNVQVASGKTAVVNGLLNCSTNIVSGAGAFTLAAGATLGIGSPDGIALSDATGNIQVTGTRSFDTGANYTYNGSGAQVTGDGLPATVNNLTVTGSSILTLDRDLTINGNLAIDSGATLDLGGYSASVEGSVTNNGAMKQVKPVADAPATTSFLLLKNKAGDTTKYYGVDITPSGLGQASTTVTIRGNQAACAAGNQLIHRCFGITSALVANAAAPSSAGTIRFWYLDGEKGSEDPASMKAYRWDGTTWQALTLAATPRGTAGDYHWVEVINTMPIGTFGLADGNPSDPTAVVLAGFTAQSAGLPLLPVALVLAAALGGVALLRKRVR